MLAKVGNPPLHYIKSNTVFKDDRAAEAALVVLEYLEGGKNKLPGIDVPVYFHMDYNCNPINRWKPVSWFRKVFGQEDGRTLVGYKCCVFGLVDLYMSEGDRECPVESYYYYSTDAFSLYQATTLTRSQAARIFKNYLWTGVADLSLA